jgi:hypothetical protein
MAKQAKTSKYTPAMEQAIRDEPVLNQAVANRLASEFGVEFTGRMVIAKINSMKLPYERKAATTKTGAPVERKEALVAEIARFVEGNLDGLDKAPKAALQAVRDALAA